MKTLVIDNYDSFVYNLVQYLGELGGDPIVYRNDQVTIEQVKDVKPDRIVISPGPGTPEDPKYFGVSLQILRDLSRTTPTLGVCLGHQGIIYAYGGRIIPAKRLMHGKTSVISHDGKGVFKEVKNPVTATRYHSLVGDPSRIPETLLVTARSFDDGEIMGVRHKHYPIEGVQFHPESILTEDGKKMIKNFLKGAH